jgi:hypothetical protein
MPEEVVIDAIEPLLEDGCVQLQGEKLIIPNWLPAQEAKHSDKVRKQMSRERERARLLSQPVTGGHTESHEVTLPYPTQSNPSESNSDARATDVVPEEEPEEQTGVRHVSSRPPPKLDPGSVADFEAYLRAKPKLSDLDIADLAALAANLHDPGNVPVGMLREAIDDANDKSERGEHRHLRRGRVVGFMKQAKTKPRKPDPKPPALEEHDDTAAVARIRAMPRRKTANDEPPASGGKRAYEALASRLFRPPPETTEATLRDKAQADQRKLAEIELKAGGGGK